MTTTTSSAQAAQAQPTPQQADFTAAITSWEDGLVQQSDDANSLTKELHRLEKLPPDEAFVLVVMALASGSTQVQGDKVAIDARLMDVGSAGSGIATEVTSDTTNMETSSGATQAAAGLIGAVHFLAGQMKGQISAQGKGAWVDSSTAGAVLGACKNIESLLGSDPTTVAQELHAWATDPTGTCANGQSGTQNLQTLKSYLSTLGNAFGGYSQMQNNALQFQDNQEGQTVSISKSLCQDIVTLIKALVASLSAK